MQIRNKPLALTAVGLLAVGAAAGWSVPVLLHAAPANDTHSTATPEAIAAPAPIALGTAPNFRAIVAQNRAAVVGITTEGEMKVADSQMPQMPDFGLIPFGDEEGPFGQQFRRHHGPRGNMPMRAQGSGFIVSSDGLVLTNAHVVDGSKVVTVKLTDRREFKAKVLGTDKVTDIAVLKIDAHNLPIVRMGNSDQLSVGDYVLAIGAPFGLEETATAGIVSAKARSLPGDGSVPFIQTDAAVNPGNSGGPLFDSTGAVVGINSQIYTNSGGYQGVSFAIPINLAGQIKDQIVKTGTVDHGRLGVQVQTVDQALAESFKLDAPTGALVAQVEPNSAAARAGLKPGDVILKYNGVEISDSGELAARVSMVPPGQKATLEISRDGKPMTITATVGSATPRAVDAADRGGSGAHEQARLGLAVRPLTAEERDESGIDGGLLVQEAQGPAAEAGIQEGDVVLSVDGTQVKSVEQLRRLVNGHDKHIALLVQRGDNRIFVPIALG
jgi:serine protease Do